MGLGIAAHIGNPNTWDNEAGGLLRVPCQPECTCGETL